MPLNLFRRKAYVGVDLGADSIKLMQIEPSGDQWTITRASTVATPENAIKEGMVVDSEAVAKAVRQGMKEGRISATSAIIGVSGATVIVRSVRIPAMPEANLRKSIRFEAGRYVPSSIEDSFIEFEILGEAPENQMDVLIAAAPRELVKSRVRACIAAGLDVEVVDIEAFAQYRALVESNNSQELTEWRDRVQRLQRESGGEEEDPGFWARLRNLELPFFQQPVAGTRLHDWNGGLCWFVDEAGVLYRQVPGEPPVEMALGPAALAGPLQQRVAAAFDPHGVFAGGDR